MIVALDTDVLVNWAMAGAPRHDASRRFVERVTEKGDRVGLAPQVLLEFLHVISDPRRFETPLAVTDARNLVRQLWDGPEVERITPGPMMLHRALDLMDMLRLGRKRILDSALAATLEEAGVTRLATFNRSDFEAFHFLELHEPA